MYFLNWVRTCFCHLQPKSPSWCLLISTTTLVLNRFYPGGSDGKESACDTGNEGSIPGLGRSPGEGKGYPLSGLENSMDGIVHVVAKSWTQLSDFHIPWKEINFWITRSWNGQGREWHSVSQRRSWNPELLRIHDECGAYVTEEQGVST